MALVILPRSLSPLIPGLPHRTSVEGATVKDVIAALDAAWPGVSDRLCEAGPTLRPHINVFVDGDAADLSTPVQQGSTVHVIPAVAGGA
jgi:molybdopterin synthase sulfur carrier subunit